MEKGTAVKDYASGEELIAEIRKRAELFIAEFDDVPASELHTLKDGVDRTPAQMLAYQPAAAPSACPTPPTRPARIVPWTAPDAP